MQVEPLAAIVHSATHMVIRLLIVDAITAQGTLVLGRLKSPAQSFEFWRDQNKIRGRFVGVGNGVVVARLNKDGMPE